MERKNPKIALGVTARTDPYATLGAATVRSDSSGAGATTIFSPARWR